MSWFHRHDWRSIGFQMGRQYRYSVDRPKVICIEIYEFLLCRCGEFAINLGGMRTTGTLTPEQREWSPWRICDWLKQYTPYGTRIENQVFYLTDGATRDRPCPE